jgi:ABC-2 type transport system ATP-binding protein
MRVAGDDAVAVVDDGRAVRVQGGAPVVPALTRALVAEDVDVREIRTVERSLEEVFLEMTGTGANGELR